MEPTVAFQSRSIGGELHIHHPSIVAMKHVKEFRPKLIVSAQDVGVVLVEKCAEQEGMSGRKRKSSTGKQVKDDLFPNVFGKSLHKTTCIANETRRACCQPTHVSIILC